MAYSRALSAPPIGVAFLLSFTALVAGAPKAHAERAPAAIEYSSGFTAKPAQTASLEPGQVYAAKTTRPTATRGALTSYGYGDHDAPASGPTIDLRGAFGDAPVAAPRVSYVPAAPPPVARAPERAASSTPLQSASLAGPLDISPPMPKDGELLGAAPAPTASALPPLTRLRGLYLVQVGAFAVLDNAERTKARAQSVGAVLVDTIERPAGPLYRVRLGPWPSRDAAEAARASIADLGFADAKVTLAN